MKSRLTTVEDVVYNQYLAKCYLSENYTLTKQEGPLLHKPLFTIQNLQDALPELTYRKINSWDNSDLITYSRDTKDTGWRKFSVIDFLKLIEMYIILGWSSLWSVSSSFWKLFISYLFSVYMNFPATCRLSFNLSVQYTLP